MYYLVKESILGVEDLDGIFTPVYLEAVSHQEMAASYLFGLVNSVAPEMVREEFNLGFFEMTGGSCEFDTGEGVLSIERENEERYLVSKNGLAWREIIVLELGDLRKMVDRLVSDHVGAKIVVEDLEDGSVRLAPGKD